MAAADTRPSEGRNYTTFPVRCQGGYVIESKSQKLQRKMIKYRYQIYLYDVTHRLLANDRTPKSFWWNIHTLSYPFFQTDTKIYSWINEVRIMQLTNITKTCAWFLSFYQHLKGNLYLLNNGTTGWITGWTTGWISISCGLDQAGFIGTGRYGITCRKASL